MIIDWRILYQGVHDSTDPGVTNVRKNVSYTIDGVSYTGTFICNDPANAAAQSSWAPQETQIAIYDYLSADTTLTTLLGSGKIFDHVPQDTAYPFISLRLKPWEDRGNYTYEGFSSLLQIDVWYQPGKGSITGAGDKQVQLIQKRIDELLHKKSITIEGWNTLILRRAFIDILVDPDNVTRHGIQQFKLFLGR